MRACGIFVFFKELKRRCTKMPCVHRCRVFIGFCSFLFDTECPFRWIFGSLKGRRPRDPTPALHSATADMARAKQKAHYPEGFPPEEETGWVGCTVKFLKRQGHQTNHKRQEGKPKTREETKQKTTATQTQGHTTLLKRNRNTTLYTDGLPLRSFNRIVGCGTKLR